RPPRRPATTAPSATSRTRSRSSSTTGPRCSSPNPARPRKTPASPPPASARPAARERPGSARAVVRCGPCGQHFRRVWHVHSRRVRRVWHFQLPDSGLFFPFRRFHPSPSHPHVHLLPAPQPEKGVSDHPSGTATLVRVLGRR